MPTLSSIGTAVPKCRYTQEEILELVSPIYRSLLKQPGGGAELFRNARVRDRYFIRPFPEVLRFESFEWRNRLFLSDGLPLAASAVRNCLEGAGLAPHQVDALFFVSTTGFTVPGLDTYLIETLGFREDTRRFPLFGWGCNGGVAGLAAAADFTRAHPRSRALLVNLETCSLAYQASDVTPKALISAAIFNDGAASALVEGDEAGPTRTRAPKILHSQSRFFSDTSRLMGWEQVATGLQVILSPKIPELAGREAKGFIAALLADEGLSPTDVSLLASHTGGAKILEALEESLNPKPEALAASWETLKKFGNMSSASVLFVLKEIEGRRPAPGSLGVALSFGPGFASEGLLLRW
jgi:alkylresorcinol/alkylpyrone synthase